MKKQRLLPLIGYFLLTVVMTWPAALHLTDGIPGDGFDGWQNYWNLWWVKQAHLVEGRNPYFTGYLYAPTGVSLLFHTLNIFNGWWTLPVQLNLGLAPAYHSVVFFSFTMAGYGAYLLCLYTLTRLFPARPGLRWAAFAGGLVFTMSPFHLAHLLGHMQVFSLMWPPFYILYLLRTLEPWTPPAAQAPAFNWRNIILSALFLSLTTLVDWYQTLYLLIFTGLVLLWLTVRLLLTRAPLPSSQPVAEPGSGFSLYNPKPQNPKSKIQNLKSKIQNVALIGTIFGLLLSPLLIPMIRDASGRADLETGLVQNTTLSADLLAFVLPSELHPLWGEWAKEIADQFTSTTSERLIFVGFLPLALAGFITLRRWSASIVKFWVFITGVFFILALGPYLHLNGWTLALGGWEIPMPYLLLYHTIPFLELTRSLSRYSLMIMLSLGVLAALALVELGSFRKDLGVRRWRAFRTPILSLLATGIICFEFLPVPFPISKIDTPQFFFDLAAQPEDYTIAELPMNWDRPTPLLHQTTHRKRLLTAYTSRNNPLELAWRIPVFQHWRHLGPDIIDQPLEQIAPTIFFDFNLRYIVLDYWQMPPGPEREATERWVAAALPDDLSPIYDDGRLKVYQTPAKTETEPYLSLGQGWGDRQERPDGKILRIITAAEPAEIMLHHPQSRPLLLELTAAANDALDQQLHLFAGDKLIGTIPVESSLTPHQLPLPPFDAHLVKLRLVVTQSPGSILISRLGLTGE